MHRLAEQTCEACRADAPRLSREQIEELLRDVPMWQYIEDEGEPRLRRVFEVKDFGEALALTNRIGEIAEAEQHHPVIVTEYGNVTVLWWTHKIQGLHKNDFIMAAKTDQVAEEG